MKTLFFIVLTLIFIGCANITPNYFYSMSNIPKDIKIVNLNLIADDMVKFINLYKTPNNTTIYLYTKDNDRSFFNYLSNDRSFFNYLSNEFRQKGYAITQDSNLKNITFLSYKIQKADNLLLVTYNVNESKINRIYTIKNDKIASTGSISTFNLD